MLEVSSSAINSPYMWQKAYNPILNQIDLPQPQSSPKVAPKFCPNIFFAAFQIYLESCKKYVGAEFWSNFGTRLWLRKIDLI